VHVRKGLHERARQGKLNGDAPFAYRRCREEDGCPLDGHPGGVHLVEDEATALREVFRRYAAGCWSQTEAAAWLNAYGFRTRNKRETGNGRPAEPRAFTTWSVRDILSNPFYMGLVRWNRKETFAGKHEALIDADVFRACQVLRQAHRTGSKPFSSHMRPYLLKGLLRCAACGEPFWAERGGRQQNAYYRGARRGHGCDCSHRGFRAEMIDARASLLVYSLTLPSDWLKRARDRIATSGPSLKARRESLDERRRRLGRAYVDGDAEYQRELSVIDDELAAHDAKPVDETSEAAALLHNLGDLWREANISERSRILSALLEAIYIDEAGRIVGVAPKVAMVPLFAAIATRPETGVSLTAAVVGMVETGEN
jgi:hypothetical protein